MLEKIRLFLKRKPVEGKKRKGFTLVELMVAMSIVILLGGSAFFSYRHVQHMRKIAQINMDMEAIVAACLTYESLNVTGKLPASLKDLNQGLLAAESIDGAAHPKLLSSNKMGVTGANAGQVLDPWNRPYEYSATDRTVSCTPIAPDGITTQPAISRSF